MYVRTFETRITEVMFGSEGVGLGFRTMRLVISPRTYSVESGTPAAAR
jgi:hypothetical protein